ncbi:MAG: hypothetical protein ACLPQS_07165 [Acidimicrobiales bacterium]
MADERSLPERLIELAVFVPVGIAASVAEELPGLAEKGRESLSKQLQVARVLGRLTVSQAQRRVRKKMSASSPPKPAGGAGGSRTPKPGASPTRSAPRRPAAAGGSKASAHRAPAAEAYAEESSPSGKMGSDREAAAPEVTSLPIPGYDTLAASQVVQRLGSLRADELDAVRRYEVATRGRRTILHRIAQLSSSDGRASA